ncbi:hypothetical protein C7M84_018110 [Penaeus vannamei]|uniref:Uncharacterized protein n=1 Tax=Penaeus vannamei TaxID=6689 RepID=A0A3R7P8P9_PENVA|nr:hypothetical protein C7M84_018110 [Penaeus vannamei]
MRPWVSPYSCRRGPSANTTANRERTPSARPTTHAPVNASLSRGWRAGSNGPPAAASALGPRGRRGQESPSRPPGGEAQPAGCPRTARARAPTGRAPSQTSPPNWEWAGGPAPTAAAAAAAAGSRRGSPPAARSRGSPPVVVGAGPQPTRPRAGAARPRGPRKAAPPTAPAARTPPKPAPLSGTGAGKAGADKTTYDSKPPPEERHTQWGPGRNSRCKARLQRQASKQAQTGAGRRRASQARGKGRGGTLAGPVSFSTCLTHGLRRRRAWDCRGFLPFSPQGCAHPGSNSALPAKRGRGEKNRRGLSRREGKGRKRGRHSETIPNVKRGAVACVKGRTTADTGGVARGLVTPAAPGRHRGASPRPLLCQVRGGGKFGEGTDARAYQEHRTEPKPQKTPHTPGRKNREKRAEQQGTEGERSRESAATVREEEMRPWVSPYSCRRGPSANDRKQGPLLRHAQGEDALRTPHHPRPGKRLTLSRVEGGEQRGPSRRLRPRPERAQGAGEPKPPARGARPNQQDAPAPPAQGPRPAPSASSPPAAAEGGPPYSCRRGPSAHTTAGRGRSAPGATEGSPSDARQPGPPKPAPLSGTGAGEAGASSRRQRPRPPPPASAPAREGAGGRRGKGKGSPSRQTGNGRALHRRRGREGRPRRRPQQQQRARGGGRPPPPAAEAVPLSLSAQALSHKRPRPGPALARPAGATPRRGCGRATPESHAAAEGAGGPKGQGKAQAVPWPAKEDVAERPRWAGRRAARPLRPGGGTGERTEWETRGRPAAATQQAKGGARLRRPALPAPPGSPLRHPRPRTQPPLPIVGGAGPQPTRPETGPSIRPAGAGAWRALGGTAPAGRS